MVRHTVSGTLAAPRAVVAVVALVTFAETLGVARAHARMHTHAGHPHITLFRRNDVYYKGGGCYVVM